MEQKYYRLSLFELHALLKLYIDNVLKNSKRISWVSSWNPEQYKNNIIKCNNMVHKSKIKLKCDEFDISADHEYNVYWNLCNRVCNIHMEMLINTYL